METQNTKKHSIKVKLIFNPGSGANDESPVQLMDVIKEMQAWKMEPETYLIQPDSDLNRVVRDAIAQGTRLFAVCGGDGTISALTRAMLGTNAILGIIPTGTQNNVALSLGIPNNIPAAISILRTGKRTKVDVGTVTVGDKSTSFLEICSVGLFSTIFSSGDDIQHGDLTRIGDFLATLTSSPPSEIHLLLDDKQEIQKSGHVLLVFNMPYVVHHYQVGSLDSYNDGLLDVLFFADLSKLDLMGYIIKGPGTSAWEDPRIQHFRVRRIEIDTHPAMPVMADGIELGEGLARIEIRRHALTVMVGAKTPDAKTPNAQTEPGEVLEK